MEGDVDDDGGALAGGRFEADGSAEGSGPFAEEGEAEGGGVVGGAGIHAAAVVADDEAEAAVNGGEMDGCGGGAGMAGDVDDGLAVSAVEGVGDGGVEFVWDAGRYEAQGDAHAGFVVAEVPFDGGGEAEIVEERGAEVAGCVADGGDGVVEGFHEAGDGIAAGRGEVVEEHGVHAGAGEHLADIVVEPDGEASGFDFAGVLEVAGKAAEAGGLGADAVVGAAQEDDDEGEEGGEEDGGGCAADEEEAQKGLVVRGQVDG